MMRSTKPLDWSNGKARLWPLGVGLLILACASGDVGTSARPDATRRNSGIGQKASERSLFNEVLFGPNEIRGTAGQVWWTFTIGAASAPITVPWYLGCVAGVQNENGSPVFEDTVRDCMGFAHGAHAESAPAPFIDVGDYHALVIGIAEYAYQPDLETPINDAADISSVLQKRYGFEVEVLENATHSNIISALHERRTSLGAKDNLLVYYAGHGHVDDATGEGYWLPADAERDVPTNWISNSTISTALKGIPAKHILLVADSCFSGTLNRSAEIPDPTTDPFDDLARKKARVVLTSGGLEPVADAGSGRNSIFATYLLRALAENHDILQGRHLFAKIKGPVMGNAPQTPEYGDIRFTGHDGGDFLFVPTSLASTPERSDSDALGVASDDVLDQQPYQN